MNLEQLKAIVAGMTPGKWRSWTCQSGWTKITGIRSPGADSALVVVEGTGGSIARINAADATGIATLKNHAERLIAVAEAAKAACEDCPVERDDGELLSDVRAALKKLEGEG